MHAKPPTYAYGITTVPSRRKAYLHDTVASLKAAGFDIPILFVDGKITPLKGLEYLHTVYRSQPLRAYGNWLMALMELWIRFPRADRYAIFQDDFVTYKNLRAYLDACTLPNNCYWNLLTFPQNEERKPHNGWFYSNQRGRGAVALIFPHEAVFKLLTSENIMAKPLCQVNPHRSIDGCLVEAANRKGISELVHYPTLVHHTGDCSSLANVQHAKPQSFQGEEFDALTFLSGVNQ